MAPAQISPDAAAHHLQIGIGADHRQVSRPELLQQRLIVGDGLLRPVGAAEEHEIRAGGIAGHSRDRGRSADRGPSAARWAGTGGRGPAAQPSPPRERLPGFLAGGMDDVVEVGRDAQLGRAFRDGVGAARSVGQDAYRLAGCLKFPQSGDSRGIGGDAIMQNTPEIENEGIVVAGDFSQGRQWLIGPVELVIRLGRHHCAKARAMIGPDRLGQSWRIHHAAEAVPVPVSARQQVRSLIDKRRVELTKDAPARILA